MLADVKQHLKFMAVCLKYNLAREMDNRAAFIMQVLGMMMNNGIMLLQWAILFSFTDTIGGYGFREVMLLWGLAAGTFGFAHALFVNVVMLPGYITGGKLDAYLVQPKHALVNVACGRMSVSAVGDLLYGLLLALLLKASPVTLLMFVYFIISGGLVLAAFFTISGCLAFWLTHSEDFSGALNGVVINFATYPEGLFNGMAKWLLFTLAPVGFTVYVPLRFLTTLQWEWFIVQTAFTVLIVILAFAVFNKGLKRYNSGNMMSARL